MLRSVPIVLSILIGCSGPIYSQKQLPFPPFKLDGEKKRVVAQDARGKQIWATDLKEEIGGVRPPHLLWDAKRVYVTHGDGATSLDANNGKILWHAKGPTQGMLLSDGMLLGIGHTPEKDGSYSCWLYGCDATKGTETFKTRLPDPKSDRLLGRASDPSAVQLVADLFLVQGYEPENSFKWSAQLYDRKGTVRHKLDRRVVGGKQYSGDAIFMTGKDVIRVTARDKPVWTVSFEQDEFLAGGQLVDVAGGDMIVTQFGCINDSGVSLIRFDPANGKVKWQHHCPGIGGTHSGYNHDAKIAIEGEKVQITSVGDFGTFVEVLDLTTGRRMNRTRK